MKVNKYTHLIYSLGIILSIVVILPLILDFFDINTKILVLSTVGNYLIILIIGILIVDLFFLLVEKKNHIILAFVNMSLVISLFLLMEYCFLNDYFSFVYVFENSKTTLPLLYKMVAIWASEEGSILTWITLNFILIAFYRIKSGNKEDTIFRRSVLIMLLISIIFLMVMYFLSPFRIQPGMPGEGLGISPLLESPYMVLHPPFVFLGYAIFLIPFSIALSELITPQTKLELPYQKSYFNFTMKFGWLVVSLGIGLGAYWASITSGWGGYWTWDPVETVSLLPWLMCTAYFHAMSLKTKRKNIIRFTVVLIFLTNIFATLLTRSGDFSPLHSFTGGGNLPLWTTIIGLLALILIIYIVYDVLNLILEETQNLRSSINYLSYFFVVLMAFVFMFGLIFPPLTFVLGMEPIYVGMVYYSLGGLICAVGLAVSLIFCSLYDIFDFKRIIIVLSGGFLVGLIVLLIPFFSGSVWINPVIALYFIALLAATYNLARNLTVKHGMKQFFRRNSKTIIHMSISLILIGTATGTWLPIQGFFYITGFILLIIAITPSIIVIFLVKQHQGLQREKLD